MNGARLSSYSVFFVFSPSVGGRQHNDQASPQEQGSFSDGGKNGPWFSRRALMRDTMGVKITEFSINKHASPPRQREFVGGFRAANW
jgi:hypothetical protein